MAKGKRRTGRKGTAAPESEIEEPKLKRKVYQKELDRLQRELVKLQSTIQSQGLRVVVVFEGRDAAGKGGALRRITDPLNPRVARIVALGVPTAREKEQWYFQRYVAQLPAAGEMVLFDRSWYNRAGVDKVMGFATDAQCREFLRACPDFERLLLAAGIVIIKYWFAISEGVQEKRLQDRVKNPAKRWKLSPMDLEARMKWNDYSRARDTMFEQTNIPEAPWYVVNADDKRRARLNCIRHLLQQIPYTDKVPTAVKLPPRPPRRKRGGLRGGTHSLVKDWY